MNFKLKIEEVYGGIQIIQIPSVRQSKRWYRA